MPLLSCTFTDWYWLGFSFPLGFQGSASRILHLYFCWLVGFVLENKFSFNSKKSSQKSLVKMHFWFCGWNSNKPHILTDFMYCQRCTHATRPSQQWLRADANYLQSRWSLMWWVLTRKTFLTNTNVSLALDIFLYFIVLMTTLSQLFSSLGSRIETDVSKSTWNGLYDEKLVTLHPFFLLKVAACTQESPHIWYS